MLLADKWSLGGYAKPALVDPRDLSLIHISEPTPLGGVQVPPSGRPLVLLADKGSLGGYAKPALVDPRDLWLLRQARPGVEIHFTSG